ncbi:C40 family peptidase, partial [Corynebacterium sphenisci]|uniref:C40 family peptidase n=1 Tax=Corynebacterium sphenisci TaxID=191493 RepID=UPI0026DEF352
ARPAAAAPPPAAGAGAPTPQAAAAVRHALGQVGVPYRWGAESPGEAFDCSGLTHWAYGEAGVDIPRTAAAQAVGRPVGPGELLPGDLVVWEGHVAMVVDEGRMVEAGDPVGVHPIRTSNLGMAFLGFWRPTG